MTLLLVAGAVADAAAYLSGMPPTPAPLERTDRAPWVWATAQARRCQVDPVALAAALGDDEGRDGDLIETVAVRADGLLEVTLRPDAIARAVLDLAAGAGMPSALLPASPARLRVDLFQLAVTRFEAARTAGGAPALALDIAVRRTLDNPVMVVLLAHARSARVAKQALPTQAAEPDAGRHSIDPSALLELTEPLDLALLTDLLDAPRRLARPETHPHDVAAGLLAVATAYLAWEERCPAIPTRPGEVTTSRHLARQIVSQAGRSVLERGMALLGISAPARM